VDHSQSGHLQAGMTVWPLSQIEQFLRHSGHSLITTVNTLP
jgi:hypothetical protein